MTPVSDESDAPVLTVPVTVGDLYMLLAWADEGLRARSSESHPRARQIIDKVRADMNDACDVINREGRP